MKPWLLIISALALSACATSSPTENPVPAAEYLEMAEQRFVSPSEGMIFQLRIGRELSGDSGSTTEVPHGIPGVRQATSSYYSIEDKNGSDYGDAESSISVGLEYMIERIKIQHEPESGRILVIEDTSDALPLKRYILFTPTRPGYSVHYLAPEYESHFEEQGYPSPPPQVILLSQDRAWIDGEIIPISRIPKSKHPFSLGG